MAVGTRSEAGLAWTAHDGSTAPSEKAGLTSAAAAAVAGALLAPKRKKGGGMERVATLDALCVECNCRSSKACTALARPASTPAAAAAVRCSYYEEAAEKPRGCPRLYSFAEAPASLRFNPHIRSGYRAGYSYGACCRSLLAWHNETVNCWTHLAPALLLAALLAGGQLQAWSGARLAFFLNVGSIAACFLGSTAYHTFMAHHHEHDKWLKLDVCGILLVLVGGGHMVLWWGFACFPTCRAAFAAAYYACGAAAVAAALRASSALGRGLPMLALLLVRLGAFATRAALEPPSAALRHYAAMEVCSLAGGLLNVLRVPERWLQPADPGKAAPLDYLLNSHQIMHVLVAAAMWQLHLGAAQDYATVAALADGSLRCAA